MSFQAFRNLTSYRIISRFLAGSVGLVALSQGLVLRAIEPATPISANSPHVVLSLTTQRNTDDSDFFSVISETAIGPSLPLNDSPHYAVAIYDTGAPLVILGNKAAEKFNIRGSGRSGTELAPLAGVFDTYNSDPLGNFVAGLGSVQSVATGGALAVDRSQLKGSYNDSIVYAGPGDQLPTLVGTTISMRYTTVINYSDPQLLKIDDATVRSPSVELRELGSVERPSRRLGLTISDGALGPIPTFLPNLASFDINDLGNNPSFPTIAGSFFLTANVKNNGVERSQLQMFYDTGSQATIVSEQIAAEMGFDVSLDDPDFVVRIQGVTDTFEDVPGFYADEFILPGTGGGLVLRDVPLVVFNFADPRSPNNTLPGIIGMNLFADRNLVLNPEPGAPYLGVSDPVFEQHRWSTTAPMGDWETESNWDRSGTPDAHWQALLTNMSGEAQVARVNSDAYVAMLQVEAMEGSVEPMTVEIAAGTEFTVFGNVILMPGGHVHLEPGAHLAPLAVEIRGGTISGSGTIDGEVLSQGTLSPGGEDSIGLLTFGGSMDQLSRGVLQLEIGDASSADRVVVELDSLLDGSLHLSTLDSLTLDPEASAEYLLVQANTIFGELDNITFDGVSLTRNARWDFQSQRPSDTGKWANVTLTNDGDFDQVMLSLHQALAGDANGDGTVAFEDFLVLSNHFGMPGTWGEGDFDGDKMVEFGDFLLLSQNFGRAGQALAVPEPAMSWTFALGCFVLIRRRTSVN